MEKKEMFFMAEANTTTDHEEIRKWVEERGGHPACVCGTGDGDEIGMIRIDFPGYSGEGKLKPISWEECFEKFEEKKLAFLFQEEKDGHESRFNKLVSRKSAEQKAHAHG